MPVSEAQKRATENYLKTQDEMKIRVPKGKKDTIKAYAESKGESLNGFINRAIDETIQRDNE